MFTILSFEISTFQLKFVPSEMSVYTHKFLQFLLITISFPSEMKIFIYELILSTKYYIQLGFTDPICKRKSNAVN